MAEAGSIANNGVNVAALIAAREELTKGPTAAQFKWRAACEWKNGTHSHSTVEGFYGLGQEQHHKRTFSFDADHPELFASEDKGATPVEYVLVGLASCLTAGIAAIAQHRNIQLRSVTATLEGDMDLQGILGIDDDVRNGFGGIKVTYKIDADAKREYIEDWRKMPAVAANPLRLDCPPEQQLWVSWNPARWTGFIIRPQAQDCAG
jgi:uncharacterized OsmC-like protein